jgi:hypothetical protein
VPTGAKASRLKDPSGFGPRKITGHRGHLPGPTHSPLRVEKIFRAIVDYGATDRKNIFFLKAAKIWIILKIIF